MVTQMQAYGAMVVAVEDKAHRWTLLEAGVRRFGWFPTSPFFGPVVGSNPYGIEGYKSLAYEVAEQLGWRVPDWVVLPVCYGDALVGMARGFAELVALKWIERMPRLVAAEVYGSLSQAEREGRDDPPSIPRSYDTVAVSIGAAQSTFQALKSVRETRGAIMRVPDDVLLRWHRDLACKEGLFVEPSSAAAVAAVDLLRRQGTIRAGETVTCLLTAGGLKDPAAVKSVPPIPTVPPDLDRVLGVLEKVYGVDATQLSNPQAEGNIDDHLDEMVHPGRSRGAHRADRARPSPAFAFPDRPITMVVPWAPGGSTDQTARVLAHAAEKQLGQPIVILNKPGASTIIGMRELAQAKPDGYTIGTLSSSSYLRRSPARR